MKGLSATLATDQGRSDYSVDSEPESVPREPPPSPRSENHPVFQVNVKDASRSARSSLLLDFNSFPGGPSISENNKDDSSGQNADGEGALTRSDTGVSEGVMTVLDLGFNAVLKERDGYDGPLRPDSNSNIEKWISDEINNRIVSCNLDEQHEYLPINAFESIFSTNNIELLFKQKYPGITPGVLQSKLTQIVGEPSREVETSRRRILALLIQTKQFDCWTHFVEAEVFDRDFPFKHSRDSKTSFWRSDRREVPDFFRDWDIRNVRHFKRDQRMFFVPFFDFSRGHLRSYRCLDSSILLPWMERSHTNRNDNGAVHKVKIHSSHHNYKSPDKSKESVYFALKEIDSKDIYENELRAHEKYCAKVRKEKHLLTLLLTFQHHNKHYLLFDWADSNLEEFWEAHSASHTIEYQSWVTQQCLGIANAIKRIHGVSSWTPNDHGGHETLSLETLHQKNFGRHGDIKPSNILCFQCGETGGKPLLVVGDLGLTSFHSKMSQSLVQRASIAGLTYRYRAPEFELKKETITPRYDTWSLGCVYLEFCIWYLEGTEGSRQFDEEIEEEDKPVTGMECIHEDKFFNVVYDSEPYAVLKTAVKEQIERLRQHRACTKPIEGLLNLIRDGMLVTDTKTRYKIDRVCSHLLSIVQDLNNERNKLRETDIEVMGISGGFPHDFANMNQLHRPAMIYDEGAEEMDRTPRQPPQNLMHRQLQTRLDTSTIDERLSNHIMQAAEVQPTPPSDGTPRRNASPPPTDDQDVSSTLRVSPPSDRSVNLTEDHIADNEPKKSPSPSTWNLAASWSAIRDSCFWPRSNNNLNIPVILLLSSCLAYYSYRKTKR